MEMVRTNAVHNGWEARVPGLFHGLYAGHFVGHFGGHVLGHFENVVEIFRQSWKKFGQYEVLLQEGRDCGHVCGAGRRPIPRMLTPYPPAVLYIDCNFLDV